MECSDNTEIAVHDSGHRLASLIYYEGAGNNKITIGRDMGWGSLSNVLINGATTLQNNTTINGVLSLKNDVWHQTNDSIYRFYFAPNSTTFICSGGISTDNNLIVYSSAASGGYNVNLGILNNGNTTIRGTTNIGGLLSCPNITLGSNGKINSSDDYHYIQISQPTDTLTLQEYGTITFNIGPTKTQRAFYKFKRIKCK